MRAFLAVKAERAPISRLLQLVFAPGQLDSRALAHAAALRAQRAVARVLAGGAAPDAAGLARAGILCAALEGVVRAAITDDVDRLRDPAWIEHVVSFARAAAADPLPPRGD